MHQLQGRMREQESFHDKQFHSSYVKELTNPCSAHAMRHLTSVSAFQNIPLPLLLWELKWFECGSHIISSWHHVAAFFVQLVVELCSSWSLLILHRCVIPATAMRCNHAGANNNNLGLTRLMRERNGWCTFRPLGLASVRS